MDVKQLLITFSERDDPNVRPSAGEQVSLQATAWLNKRGAKVLHMTTNVTTNDVWEDYTLTLLVEIEVPV